MTDPFHEGELAVQKRAGEETIAARNGAAISARIMPGALPFLRQQSSIVLGAEAPDGALWATMTFGRPGFLHSADGSVVTVDRSRAAKSDADPVWQALHTGSAVGMLAIEFVTRRRIRINGVVSTLRPEMLAMRVDEAFPNCPKYITQRELRLPADALPATALQDPSTAATAGTQLSADTWAMIQAADVLFLASAHQRRGLDVSHRGGSPGFVEVQDARTLHIPDYPGNSMFQTLGNLSLDRRVGLTIPDFEQRRLLQVTGTARLLWEQQDSAGLTGGSHRVLEVEIAGWQMSTLPPGLLTTSPEYSRFNPR